MSEKTASIKPDFASAQANLRDTVRWLATTFGALAAFVVGGASVNGLGGLSFDDPLFLVAAACLGVGFLAICGALYLTLNVLRPLVLYRSTLVMPTDSEGKAAQAEIDEHVWDLLPHNFDKLIDIGREIDDSNEEISSLEEQLAKVDDLNYVEKRRLDGEYKAWKQSRDEHIKTLDSLIGFAMYFLLKRRFDHALPRLFVCGAIALLSLAAFAVLTHEKKGSDDKATRITNVLPPAAEPQRVPPALTPVLFSTGSAHIAAEGLSAIEKARQALRENPDMVLLIRAHTDTVASMPVNVSLAQRRAVAVRQVLLGVGGIPSSRVFVSEMPKADLPSITKDETAERRNRSAELVLVNSPVQLQRP